MQRKNTMSQSKFSKIYPLLLWGGFLLWVILYFYRNYPFVTSNDFSSYIGSWGNLDDWRSPFMNFKIGILHTIFELYLNKFISLSNFIGVSYSLIFVASCALILHTLRSSWSAVLAFFIFLFMSDYFHEGMRAVRADYVFFAQISLIFAIVFYSLVNKIRSKLLVAFLLLLLLDTITWRQQGVLLIPFLVFYILRIYPTRQIIAAKLRVLWTFIITAALVGGDYILKYEILQARKLHPQSVMMLSDVRNASVLSGSSLGMESINMLPKLDGRIGDVPNVIAQSFYFVPAKTCNEVSSLSIEHPLVYQQIKKAWLRAITEQPKAFATGRVISCLQFLFWGRVPDSVDHFLKRSYPHMITDYVDFSSNKHGLIEVSLLPQSSSWRIFGLPVRDIEFHLKIVDSMMWCVRLIAYGWLLLAPFFLWMKISESQSTSVCAARLSWFISLVYLVSYLPFTPTADSRFVILSLFFSYLSLVLVFFVKSKKGEVSRH